MLSKKKQKNSLPYAENEGEYGDYKVKRNKTLDNIMLIVSLLAALALWIYVYNSTNTTDEKTFNLVSIEKKNADALFEDYDLVVQSMNIDTLNVSVMGSKDAMSKLDISDIKAYINLSGINEANEYTLDVLVDVPEGITCVSQTVYRVEVRVDRSTSKEFTIDSSNVMLKEWSLEQGYELGNLSTNITKVTLEGSSTDISKVASVGVMTGAVGNIKNNMTANCQIVLLDASGNQIELPGIHVKTDKPSIEAKIEVLKRKIISLEVSTLYGYVPSELVKITPAQIEIFGDPALVDSVSSYPLTTVNEKEIGVSAPYTREFELSLNGLQISDGNGNKVERATVEIDLGSLEYRTIQGVELYKGGDSIGYVEVTLVAKRDDEMCTGMLNKITAEEIKAYYEDGMNMLAINFDQLYAEYIFESGNAVPDDLE